MIILVRICKDVEAVKKKKRIILLRNLVVKIRADRSKEAPIFWVNGVTTFLIRKEEEEGDIEILCERN